MQAVIQRVKSASVSIDSTVYSSIGQGILVLLGVEKGDTKKEAEFLANKITKLRIFEDTEEKMNLSVKDINGEILVVSQFTLAGDCKKGTRPSFDNAATPDIANDLYELFNEYLIKNGVKVKTGKFRAMMDVKLINDGPVTFILSKKQINYINKKK